jgi:histidinol phosphatase-like enzyme (inositol monophosphatase family)
MSGQSPAAFDIQPHTRDITELVRSASRLALRWHRRPMAVENKLVAGFDPVTEADRAVEDAIRAGLAQRFPNHAILGEERGETGSGRYRWVIDPIDGTRAFISGQPMWGTLVGFQVDGRPVAGWMHVPVLDETWVATPAGGSVIRADGPRPVGVSAVTELSEAILLCTHPSMFEAGPSRTGFEALEASVRLSRFSGDCLNYGLLAAGHADLVVENGLAPYDILPLLPILAAAGAVVTDLEGAEPLEGGFVVAAATPQLHAQALRVLRRA